MPQGLTSTEAHKKLSQYGLNEITESSKSTPFKILLRQAWMLRPSSFASIILTGIFFDSK